MQEKSVSLTYHYSELPEKYRKNYLKQAQEISESYGYETFAGHNLLEIKPPVQWNKGNFHEFLFILYACEEVKLFYCFNCSTVE